MRRQCLTSARSRFPLKQSAVLLNCLSVALLGN